ncbi:MAG: glucuronate isomerase [Lentisphaeraceae bacterium]|nr:glucuronate isomerase [Lentisphaeraceae bacterium]
MKKEFMCKDFVLENETASELYHKYAAPQPIIDYHNHLPSEDIANDKVYKTITEVALGGDHYKWRAMRINGIEERLITGDASDKEKWDAWAATMPHTLRNPLFHWQHLELQRYFGITDVLSPKTADAIYDKCNEMLAQPGFSARGLLAKMKVEVVCTTDDPADNLEHHIAIKNEGIDLKVLPTFRPDKTLALDDAKLWNEYVDRLAAAADQDINSFDELISAVQKRHDFFHEVGCRLSDHGLPEPYGESSTPEELNVAFDKIRSGKEVLECEKLKLRTALMVRFGRMNAAKGWTMQLHMGPIRNNSTRMFNKLGADAGFDSIGDRPIAESLSSFLNMLDITAELPKTILYNINPSDNETLATMCGNFSDGSTAGKVQFGSGWWFLDQKDGMEKQMTALSNLGLISRFVGMLTDSRSFLSFPRHEYFRRILCNLFVKDMENGEIPYDMEMVGGIIEDICYNNAKKFFGFYD